MKWAAAAFFLCGILASSSIDALEIKIIENQMIVSGGIETNDGWTFARAVANNPQVDTIVLRDMPGGKVSAMRQMVNALEDRKLTTVVSRSCRSACAVVFLAGERRQFADDYPAAYSYLGFHSPFRSEGSLKGYASPPIANEHLWFVKRTGGKLDPEIAKQFLSFEHASAMAFFYHPARTRVSDSTTYMCVTKMPLDQCTKVEKSSFDYGLITSTELVAVKDDPHAGPQPSWDPDHYKKSGPVAVLLEEKSFSDGKKKVVTSYIAKNEPKALALSSDRKWINWVSNKSGKIPAMYDAIKQCQEKAKVRCHIIAIDDDLAIPQDNIRAGKFL